MYTPYKETQRTKVKRKHNKWFVLNFERNFKKQMNENEEDEHNKEPK